EKAERKKRNKSTAAIIKMTTCLRVRGGFLVGGIGGGPAIGEGGESLIRSMSPNDPSSATRRTGRNDCNRDAPAGFAAAYGWAGNFALSFLSSRLSRPTRSFLVYQFRCSAHIIQFSHH